MSLPTARQDFPQKGLWRGALEAQIRLPLPALPHLPSRTCLDLTCLDLTCLHSLWTWPPWTSPLAPRPGHDARRGNLCQDRCPQGLDFQGLDLQGLDLDRG